MLTYLIFQPAVELLFHVLVVHIGYCLGIPFALFGFWGVSAVFHQFMEPLGECASWVLEAFPQVFFRGKLAACIERVLSREGSQ